ncbi:unnamed protein product [Brachionus calyciflorus]|uniref:DUF4795 domain-containing protein n=1 Tax=Brachionus calyciflorus TaxID=104777 RepID=A0A813TFT1_9BILA|nr:unnamed protein product [Brachionus calyciflorus]
MEKIIISFKTVFVGEMASTDKNSDISLNRLLHLALCSSPQVGIVNFNLLKTFLLELLKALNLQHFEPKFSDDSNIQNLVNDVLQNQSNNEKFNLNNYHNDSNNLNNNLEAKSDTKAEKSSFSLMTSGMKPLSLERIIKMEDKLAKFEQQMTAFDSLPSNQQIIDKVKDTKKSENSSPILEIWKYTQLSKRLESNEEGITKLTSLVQDLIDEIHELKDNQLRNDKDIKKLDDQYTNLLNRINSFDKTLNNLPSNDRKKDIEDELNALKKLFGNVEKFDVKLKDIADQIKTIETKLYTVVHHPDLELYVTWPALENSLKGLKDALDSAMRRELVVNEQTQTIPVNEFSAKPVDRATSPHNDKTQEPPKQYETVSINEQNYIKEKTPSFTPSSRPSSFHPSKELQDILSKLGTLNERHESLRDIVDKLRFELGKKPQPQSINEQSIKLPDDFAEKMDEIKNLKSLLEQLKKNFSDETNKRLELEGIITNLNNSLDNIRNSLKECLKNTQLNKEDIMSLKEAIKMLDETKADKDWIKSEFERKADKRDMEQKVNKKQYDDHFHDLSNSINDCKLKTTNLEDEYRKGNESLIKELESKLDRLELDGLKDYIEKQLRKLKKLQKESVQPFSNGLNNSEDDAAGLRRQLLRFHCISCDRPIDMPAQNAPYPTLPAERGMRPIQTPRPYTTYELDQIRQFQKQQLLNEQSYDLFATVRQCGGSHTLTVPNKKMVKMSNPVIEESQSGIAHRNEVHLQGQDGHIYKGRIEARLSVDMKKQVKNQNKNPINNSFQNLRTASEIPDEQIDKLHSFTN